MSKLSDFELKNQNVHFLADLQTYNRKEDKAFADWMAQAGKIANGTHWSELQLA